MISTDLAQIASHLEGLEETIIHRLIDRAQFAHNPVTYERGKSGFSDDGTGRSLLEIRLRFQEEMDAVFGRYMVAEERPVHPDLPSPRRRITVPESPLDSRAAAGVNRSSEILASYIDFVPAFCVPGDDGHYGSAVEHDVLAVQAIGRRVHYGALYVAESKFREDQTGFAKACALADDGDTTRILTMITRPDVERRILARLKDKVNYIQASLNEDVRRRIDPDIVVRLYRETIIPVTKQGEIDYLLLRCHPHAS